MMRNMVLKIHRVSKPPPRTFLPLGFLRIHRRDGSQVGPVQRLLFEGVPPRRHRTAPIPGMCAHRCASAMPRGRGRRPARPRGDTHRVVKLLQPRDGKKVLHVHPVFDQELHEVHAIQDQGVQHGLLQRVHLHGRETEPALASGASREPRQRQAGDSAEAPPSPPHPRAL